jgi:hypothetical protein
MSNVNKFEGIETIEQVARHMAGEISFSDRKYVKNGTNEFDFVGRHIRNEYGLWIDHPLTKRWREDETSRDIRNGVDYSVDHPDQMSETIRLKLVEILIEEDGA